MSSCGLKNVFYNHFQNVMSEPTTIQHDYSKPPNCTLNPGIGLQDLTKTNHI